MIETQDIINHNINWALPIELQDGTLINVETAKDKTMIVGNGLFSCVVGKNTGLPCSDAVNWDLFPVRNAVKS